MSSWQLVLLEPARTILSQVGTFCAMVFGVLVILLIGWLISKGIKALVIKGLRAINIDKFSAWITLNIILEKGGITYSLSELVGVIFYWIGLLVTFMVAINAAGLTIAADLLSKVVLYVPNVISAVFILILGMFVAVFLRNIVQTAANNADIPQVKLISKTVEVIVTVFVILVALEQLKIGIRITELTIGIILGSIGLGLALAFGLGCKDIAGKAVNDFVEKLKKK
ncbi:MAG: hypothetical protein NC923_04285 [Candidatus Omnitrophica bacterium]|nr:hypothetical protein [Candidatus Omnitrophota bacterium]